MTEPRLEESASEFERELLSAGTSYRVSAEARAKTLGALGLAGITAGAGTAAGLGSAQAAQAGGSSLWAKLGWTGWTKASVATLVTVGALVGVPAGYLALSDDPPPANGAGASPQAKAPAKLPELEPSPAAPANAAPPVAEPLAREPAAAEPSPGRVPPAKVDSKTEASAALRAELKALEGARTTLASGNAQGALALLDAYDRGYPRGLLKLEAEVLRIDALARSGQTDAARRRADAFLRQHPKSVLASRVRRYSAP
jgi:hypothetical protein